MPSHLVKTPKDEKMWEKAKSATKDDPRARGTSKWRLTNYIYQKIKTKEKNKSS